MNLKIKRKISTRLGKDKMQIFTPKSKETNQMPKKKIQTSVSDTALVNDRKCPKKNSKKSLPDDTEKQSNSTETEKPTSSLHVKLLKIKNMKKITSDTKNTEVTPKEDTLTKENKNNESTKNEIVNQEDVTQKDKKDPKSWNINGWRSGVNKHETKSRHKSQDKSTLTPLVVDEIKNVDEATSKLKETNLGALELVDSSKNSTTLNRKIGVGDKEKEKIRSYLFSNPLRLLSKPAVKKPEVELPATTSIEDIKQIETSTSNTSTDSSPCLSENFGRSKIVDSKISEQKIKISNSPKLEKFVNSVKFERNENVAIVKKEPEEVKLNLDFGKLRMVKKDIECCDMTFDSSSSSSPQSKMSSSFDSIVCSRSSISRNYLPKPNLVKFFETKQEQWKSIDNKLIDSHCHFDFLFGK